MNIELKTEKSPFIQNIIKPMQFKKIKSPAPELQFSYIFLVNTDWKYFQKLSEKCLFT